MHLRRLTLLVTASFALASLSWADTHELPRTDAPAGAQAYIITPVDGAIVESPVTVVFGLRGMGVAPAGVKVGWERKNGNVSLLRLMPRVKHSPCWRLEWPISQNVDARDHPLLVSSNTRGAH